MKRLSQFSNSPETNISYQRQQVNGQVTKCLTKNFAVETL